MKHTNKILLMVLSTVLIAICICSCSNEKDTDTDKTTAIQNISKEDNQTPDLSNAVLITENGITTITNGGTYIVTGKISDGRIIVNAPEEEVIIVLDNADITCAYGSPIYIYDSSTATIYLKEDTVSTLTDGDTYSFDDSFSSSTDSEPNACLYSKSDLIITGGGTLNVNANYNNAITGDTLKIESACITVTAKNHGINGKDSCIVKDSDLDITSGSDAIRSTKGNLQICGGTYKVSAGDDGIHALGNVQITDGAITINKSYEGIEGPTVDISGGTIKITASDDGINAAGDSSEYNINISGGFIEINAGGDGMDSNGNITVSGGELYVSCSQNSGNSAIDYDGMATITGGIVIAAGYSGMAQNFGNTSTQGSILLTYQTVSDKTISIKDNSDNILAQYTPANGYNCVVISCPDIKDGNTYTVTACGETSSVTMNGLIYGNSNGMSGPNGMEAPNGTNPPDGMEPPDGTTPPNGMERPDGTTPPNGMEPPGGTTSPNGMEPPSGTTPPNGMEPPNDTTSPDGTMPSNESSSI